MNILETILAERKQAVQEARRKIPLAQLKEQTYCRVHHSLRQRIINAPAEIHIIAEMKKASPSAGILQQDYDPARIAALYEAGGASALSILTEPLHFMGNHEHMQIVRQKTDLPLLRKDFICDPYQIYESCAWGADILLLIVAALDGTLLQDLYAEARNTGLEVLIEAHSPEEAERILPLSDALIGINCRNLKTLKTDTTLSMRLREQLPADRITVTESGIKSAREVQTLKEAGYDAFLIGETLLRSPDPEAAVREMRLAKSERPK